MSSVLGGRYRLDALVGAGGMGQVYRAHDLQAGQVVAVKVLLDVSSQGLVRFQREARILAQISHPGIVRYVDHCELPEEGPPFLVMEWLEGEDLARLLARRRLRVSEVIELGAGVARALAAAHDRGIIHRDLKPANIFLRGGSTSDPKILDFGIAHLAGATKVTRTGTVVGTPSYMAPEQVSGGDEVDTRADVFSLGCVLLECLTGTPPFMAGHVVAILAKILFSEAPRASEACADVPSWLDILVAQMLEKQPCRRPANGGVIAEALTASAAPVLTTSVPVSPVLTGNERRLFSVVLLAAEVPPDEQDATLAAGANIEAMQLLRAVATRFGGNINALADGSVVVRFEGATVASDLAVRAARCALAMRERAAKRSIAVAMGWGDVARSLPIAEVIERAVGLLRSTRGCDGEPPVTLDDITAGLLDVRFDIVEQADGGFELFGMREIIAGQRTLLGKPTPCVGRDHEISLLEQTFAGCVAEPAARAILLTAPAGTGKSRLIQEFIARLQRGGAAVDVWLGRGDALRAGDTFGVIGTALRREAGIREADPIEVRRERLQARVARHLPEREHRRVAAFLGDLVDVPLQDDDNPPLRAARQDPELFGEQLQRALRDFLRAECAVQPLLLVLEDMHWGDHGTVALLDGLLRDLEDLPFMVLASGRPELHDLFPRLWATRGVQELHLKQLSPRASARLVRQVLGDAADAALIEKMIAQADGHAFYLEEVIRAVAEGRGAALPETVLAMVQARIEGLNPDVRRVLRAASIFGDVFWRGAVAQLLGSTLGATPGQDCLSALVEQEICLRRRESRFPGEEEYAFRHALLREGAYALLTEEDRELGHRLAGEWCERVGEANTRILAEHFQRGGAQGRAAAYYLRSAEQACSRHAYLDAEFCYSRAIDLASEPSSASLRGRGLARYRLGRYPDAVADLAAARALSAAEGDALAEIDLLLDEAMVLDWMGEYRSAEERVRAAEARHRAAGAPPLPPPLEARLLLGAGRSQHRADREEEAAATLRRAAELAARLGDEGYETLVVSLLLLGFILPLLGHVDEGEAALDDAIRRAEERGDRQHLGSMLNNRALLRAYRGDREGMIADFERTAALGRELGQPAFELVARFNLGEFLFLMDELDPAEQAAHAAAAVAERQAGGSRPAVVALLLARIRLYRGDEAGAAAIAAEVRAREDEARARGSADAALSPAEDVLCAMIELATRGADAPRWDALEARSAEVSVGQEQLEVLEARALAALGRGRAAEAALKLEQALAAAARIPNVMVPRLRRWLAAARREPA